MGLFGKKADTSAAVNVTIQSLIGDYTPVFEGEEQEFYFRSNGKANQGYLLELPDRTPIFEAEIIKFSLLGQSEYDFVDHVNNTRTKHFIGKTTTISSKIGHISRVLSSDFPIDGQKCLDLLWDEGYGVDTDIKFSKLDIEYTVKYKGQKIGEIKGSNASILPNGKVNKLTEHLKVPGLYKMYATPENARIMFLWGMYLSRAESSRGGAAND